VGAAPDPGAPSNTTDTDTPGGSTMMWDERPASTLAAGDCVMIDEPCGWHPRIVKRAVPDGNGYIDVHFYGIRFEHGEGVVMRSWTADRPVPVFAPKASVATGRAETLVAGT
jgi:hypothetical protein